MTFRRIISGERLNKLNATTGRKVLERKKEILKILSETSFENK